MRVLMFGWEFPPHISGGLGTASYGLTRGLSTIPDLDILFDNWFAELPDDKLEKLKTEGVTVSQLAKHEERIELLGVLVIR